MKHLHLKRKVDELTIRSRTFETFIIGSLKSFFSEKNQIISNMDSVLKELNNGMEKFRKDPDLNNFAERMVVIE